MARALTYLVYGFVIVALVILGLGFLLVLFGANPEAGFAEWVYRSLDRVMAPFRGLFEPIQLTGASVLDTSVLFAMVVYCLAGMALQALIGWLSQRLIALRRRQAVSAARAEEPTTPAVPA
jgi:uncharacterized protein YggT (Ycf19 family)